MPDGLLFANADVKASANAQGDQWKRYAHGLAVVESKRWARPWIISKGLAYARGMAGKALADGKEDLSTNSGLGSR